MHIKNGVKMLAISAGPFVLNPTLVWDDEAAVLIDTGIPGSVEQIRTAMDEAGVPFDRLKAIIITHQDLDHVGSLPELVEALDGVEVYAHPIDRPYIEGTLPLIKTDTSKMSKEVLDALHPQMRALYENPPKADVTNTVEDGDVIPYCGGIQVIFTPGHTPGHISLYLQKSKVLVAADAMICSEGKLRGPVQQTTLDVETAVQSIRKFMTIDFDQVICYHGGLCSEDAKAQLQQLVDQGNDAVYVMQAQS